MALSQVKPLLFECFCNYTRHLHILNVVLAFPCYYI